ncbi:hypothetical protein PCH_Pc14g00050 [Penicillium rubens Wisconsin 54-1255]|uniref:Uncharacterized protein n=1 Tax=Penicillium rubens (strain ATCC 28089 / DSM 1075 / NRRL 1951 / Wisconsin 54-1255) TaxID=500485 RepID=B6H5Q1_PENRW|nr:hypothetical protein PCH_Pc14g00050 [Penicillium rubens Wisconsin 54-1255]
MGACGARDTCGQCLDHYSRTACGIVLMDPHNASATTLTFHDQYLPRYSPQNHPIQDLAGHTWKHKGISGSVYRDNEASMYSGYMYGDLEDNPYLAKTPDSDNSFPFNSMISTL